MIQAIKEKIQIAFSCPFEYPLKESLRIYVWRLAIFLAVALANFILFGFVLAIARFSSLPSLTTILIPVVVVILIAIGIYIAIRKRLYQTLGEYDRAIADYTKALEINPRDAVAYINRGLAYYDKGEFDRAIADYTKALEINTRDAVAYYNRGNAYANKGEYDRAIADYNRALEINPRYDGIQQSGSCLLLQGKIRKGMGGCS